MQDITNKEINGADSNAQHIPLEEKQKLVGAFAWLIQEDKKQNPALYQLNKKQNDRHSLPINTQG